MNNVITIGSTDWKKLLMYKRSIRMYKDLNNLRYKRALDKYSKLYLDTLSNLKVA